MIGEGDGVGMHRGSVHASHPASHGSILGSEKIGRDLMIVALPSWWTVPRLKSLWNPNSTGESSAAKKEKLEGREHRGRICASLPPSQGLITRSIPKLFIGSL